MASFVCPLGARVRRGAVYGAFILYVATAHADAGVEAELDAGGPLDIHEAARLAVERQPLLEAVGAEALAAREAAVSAAQLPDPELFGGIRDLPIDTDDAYSFSRDSDTQLVVGIRQEFPRAQKRHLRGAVRMREAERLDAEHALTERMVSREASYGWLTLWLNDRAEGLAAATLQDAALQTASVEIAVRSGSATQADLVATQVNVERVRDEVEKRVQAAASARRTLQRWIGAAADRRVAPDVPDFSSTPPVAEVLEHLGRHPALVVMQARVDEADASADLADSAYRPDWRIELGYGHRREFSDMVMVQVGMDLPLFTRNRQDRDLASALAVRDAASARWEDARRELESEALLVYGDLARLTARVARYDEVVVPQASVGVDAALTAWRSARGTLAQVLDARRVRLAVELARLELRHDLARRRVDLDYLRGGER